MLKKKTLIKSIKNILLILFFNLIYTLGFAETIIFKDCENGIDGFEKNSYTIDLDKSLMTRVFTYNKKTFKKYRLTDINTKRENTITRFVYMENNKIYSDKMGYPQFYTQLVFDKQDLNIKIKTVINDEPGTSILSKCKKIDIFHSQS
tara:strand:- start:18 stop:461 length:444 start_codon:yes stop_codon:yes gene_type:complete